MKSRDEGAALEVRDNGEDKDKDSEERNDDEKMIQNISILNEIVNYSWQIVYKSQDITQQEVGLDWKR